MKRLASILLAMLLLTINVCALSEEGQENGGFFSNVGGFLEDTWNGTKEFVGDAANSIGTKTSEAWTDISQFASEQWDNLSGSAKKNWEVVTEAAGDAWYGASGAVSGVWNNITGAFEPEEEIAGSDDSVKVQSTSIEPDEQVFFLGSVVNTGKDNGYSGSNDITIDDPHYGWTLGRFYVNGFTRAMHDENGDPVFLKTVGDTVALHFELYQDIEKLNGDAKMTISNDDGGYDEYFGIPKTNFGKGTLIVRHVNYQNYENTPTIYTDFLSARSVDSANTTVELFEEGDYEVALDYEIKKQGVLNVASYTNYRIAFRFSVRNGNCMVFPFDVATGAELTDTSITENGFYLDLARSRYLDINVKKETLLTGEDGLVEDTRFNRPAKDGDQYTDEGIYTITVSNRYTESTTVKKIFVGSDEALKNYRNSGVSVGY